jgi:serine protease AprX
MSFGRLLAHLLPVIFHRRIRFAGLAGVLLLLATVQPAFAGPRRDDRKVDRAVRDSMREGAATQSVIITVKPGYRDSLRESLLRHGDVIKSEHPLIEALAAELHTSDVDELANQPWVAAVSADAFVYAKAAANNNDAKNKDPRNETLVSSLGGLLSQLVGNTLRETLGLTRIALEKSVTGSGAAVALIDSGIAPNDDFAGRISGFYDFTRGGIPTAPFDDYGHGTHVAGLIGSSGKASNYEFQGIAPDVRFVGLKVLDKNGRGRTSDVIKALEYVTANKNRLNVQIVNLSLGHPIFAPAKYDPLVHAVEKASAAGLIVVVAAGNYGEQQKTGDPGYTGINSPANAPSAITVGAVNTFDTIKRTDDVMEAYSSRGPTWFDAYVKPDLVAPGHQLSSDTSVTSYLYKLLQGNRGHANNGMPLLKLSGTSMAAGVTSGVVALMIEAHNDLGLHNQKPLTANLVKALLQYSAIPVAGADYLTQGAGEVNAAGAIALAGAIDTSAKQGSWWLRSGVSASTMIGGRTYPWSQHVIWGDAVLTGNLIYVSNIVWGTGIVWGSVDDDNIVWGTGTGTDDDNIVWGTIKLWGPNIVWSDRVIGQIDDDNIVWGTSDDDNIVWGTIDDDNIVWGTWEGDDIVWGTWDDDNIVWGTWSDDNIVWGTSDDDNIVWGTRADNIVWGTVIGVPGKSQGK